MVYLGSKRRIAKEILPIILSNTNEGDFFVDAFCGGCNLLDKVPNTYKRIANDNNEYLIAMWKTLVNGWKPITSISKELYSLARSYYREHDHDLFPRHEIGWIGFMGSFRGKFFDGGYAGSKANGRDYISEHIRHIKAQIPYLKDVYFKYGSYDQITLPPADHTTIYCDIPYKGTTQYSVSKNFDYARFYGWCRQKHKEGYRIFVSEYQMPEDFKCVWEKEQICTLSTNNTKKARERLFTL